MLELGNNINIKFQLVEKTLLPNLKNSSQYFLNREELNFLYNDVLPKMKRKSDFNRVTIIPKIKVKNRHLIREQLHNFSRGIFAPLINDIEVCNYMLYNPHIKEDGIVYPCCGKERSRIIGNLSKKNLLHIYQDHLSKYINQKTLPYKSCQHCIFFSYYN